MTKDLDEAAERVLIADAARAYVAARVALEGADGPNVLVRAVELDAAWHELHTVCGVAWADCSCEEIELEDEGRDTRTGRRVQTEKGI